VVMQIGMEPQCYGRASRMLEQVVEFADNSVLVLDLNMPEMDGVEVMRQLAQRAQLPVLILISGHDCGILRAAEKLGQAQNLEILAAFHKPLEIDHFQQLLLHHFSEAGIDQGQSPGKMPPPALLPGDLRKAIRDDQLTLHYQPQVEMASNTLIGVEALVRWQHPTLGLIFPDRFITLAEQHNLMAALTEQVIDMVIKQIQQWRAADLPLAVAVNISADNITSLLLPEQISDLMTSSQLDPTLLTLEVTETALMRELVTSLDVLTRLRMKGTGLSIDDFGTGYSSLAQLHRVPFTELKIDLSFVSVMVQDPQARAIVKTCIMLGHELDMRVVAEGVEDQRTLDLLRVMGCDVVQGYLIARPMPANELRQWASSWHHRELI